MRDVAVSPAPAARKWSDRRARFDFGRNARFFNSRASSPPSIARRPIPAFPPVPREPDCFPESAPGSARHAYRGLNTHLDLGRLEGRDGAGERGGNAGQFCWVCFRWCSKNVCGNGADEASDAPFVPNCRFQTRPVPSRGNQIPRSDWRKPRIALDHSQISILSGTVEGLKIAFGGNRNFKDCSLVADIRSCLWPMRFR